MSSGALFVEPIEITSEDSLVATNVGSDLDPADWDAGTAYALDDQVASGESIYQSLQAANTNHAVTDPAWWMLVGAVNRMRMFDRKVGAQTENLNSINVVIQPTEVVTVLSLRNVLAISATVTQETEDEGVIYIKSVTLDDPVGDWFEFFFSPITYQTEALFTDILPVSGSTIAVLLFNPDQPTKCGELLMGPALDAGITEAGVSDGIDDYSVVAPDEFGVRDIVERDYADNMDLTVYVDVSRSATLKRLLTKNRARPILVVPSSLRPDAQVYGLAESWRRVLTYPGTDVFRLTMRGLT